MVLPVVRKSLDRTLLRAVVRSERLAREALRRLASNTEAVELGRRLSVPTKIVEGFETSDGGELSRCTGRTY